AAGPIPAGDVAADAVVVELLADLLERLPRLRVLRLLPLRDLIRVTVGARLGADVGRRAGGHRLRRDRLGGLDVGEPGGAVVLLLRGDHLGVARQRLRDAHLLEREVAPGRRYAQRVLRQ